MPGERWMRESATKKTKTAERKENQCLHDKKKVKSHTFPLLVSISNVEPPA